MVKLAQLLTAEDVLSLPSSVHCELIDGVLIEVPPANAQHGGIAFRAGSLFDAFARPRGLGMVFVEVGFILRRNPDTVRAPDAAFVRAGRIPPGGPPNTFWEIAPDIAVEVISPGDRPAEVQAKIREWVEAGTPAVIVVYPEGRRVTLVRSLLEREELDENDVIEGLDALPGFSGRVADLFE